MRKPATRRRVPAVDALPSVSASNSSRWGPSAAKYLIHAGATTGSLPSASAFEAANNAPVGECWKQNRTPSAVVSPGPNSADVGYAVVPWNAQSAAGAVDNVPDSDSPSRPHTLALPAASGGSDVGAALVVGDGDDASGAVAGSSERVALTLAITVPRTTTRATRTAAAMKPGRVNGFCSLSSVAMPDSAQAPEMKPTSATAAEMTMTPPRAMPILPTCSPP